MNTLADPSASTRLPSISLLLFFLAALFITCLLTANIIAVKLIALPLGLILPGGTIIFPLSYLFGDVLTECYGYGATRLVIWTGFFCNLLLVLFTMLTGIWPGASLWHDQAAYQTILGFAPRLFVASLVAYMCGEFLNSYVMASLKVRTRGSKLWLRAWASTLLGQGVDTLLFLFIAFWGLLPLPVLLATVLTQWLFKFVYEIIATPIITYPVVGWIKRTEGVEPFDEQTNWNPLLLWQVITGRQERVERGRQEAAA
jgi:queuosine precursor transporter